MDISPFTVKRKGHDLWKKILKLFLLICITASHTILVHEENLSKTSEPGTWISLTVCWHIVLKWTRAITTGYCRSSYIYIYKPAVEVSFNVPKPQKKPQRTNPLKCLRNEKSLKIDVNIDYRHVCYYPEQLSMQETAVILPITYTEFIVCTSEFLTSWSARVFGVAWLLSSQKGADRQGRRMAMEINSPLSNKLDH